MVLVNKHRTKPTQSIFRTVLEDKKHGVIETISEVFFKYTVYREKSMAGVQ